MRTIKNKKLVVFIILVLLNCGIPLTKGIDGSETILNNKYVIGSQIRNVVSDTKDVKPVVHEELMKILENIEKGENIQELNNRFNKFPKEQKLETAEYCLKENKHINQMLLKMSIDASLWDKCLVPYIAETMPKLKDRDLMIAARVSSKIPDVNLIEPLLNYAVDSNYSEWDFDGLPGRGARAKKITVFEYSAMAISTITNGKIGKYNPGKTKETLIREWRDSWPEIKSEMQKEIRPIAHQELLDLFAKAEEKGLSYRDEFVKQFITYKCTERLETIAYALEHKLYPHAISCYMLYTDKDKRLLPFISKAIKESKEINLYAAVQIASANPDPSLLPSLMKYGFDSDYLNIYRYGDGERDVDYTSVFGFTAKAIFEITNGKIGSQDYYLGYYKEVPGEEKKTQIEKWRKTYEETLKKDYEKN